MISSKSKYTPLSVELRVPYSGPEQPHEAFANLRDEPEALETFYRRFGPKEGERYYGSRESFAPRYAKMVYSYRHDFRRAWRGEQDALDWLQHNQLRASSFTFNTQQNHIVMEPET